MNAFPDPADPRDELLLDAVLGGPARRAAARQRLGADPTAARELRAFEGRLERARAELRDGAAWSLAREQLFVERVLASTTRVERGWAEELAFRVRHLGRALVDSPTLRLAAACAVLLLGTLPLVLERRVPGSDASGAARPAAPLAQLRSASLAPRMRFAVTLAADRDVLEESAAGNHAGTAWSAPAPGAPLELRLLEARARGLRERRWDTWLKELSLADLDPLALALWCEVELDRFVLTGERPPAWPRAVAILEAGLRTAATDESTRLLEKALARARTYGLAPADGGRAPAEPTLVARADAQGELWSGEWFANLASAGREAGLEAQPQWRAWVAFGLQ